MSLKVAATVGVTVGETMPEGNEMHRWAERRAGAFAGGVVRVEDEHDVYRRNGRPCRVWGTKVMKRE
jgi:formamidopyrimidine-DNA glycosylase